MTRKKEPDMKSPEQIVSAILDVKFFLSRGERKDVHKTLLLLSTHLGTGTLNSFQLITNLLELQQKSTTGVLGKSNA